MAIKVGINGFGRIGRVALRIMVERGSSSYQICGNLMPVPCILLLLRRVFALMRKSAWLGPKVDRLERRAHLKGRKVRKYRTLGLVLLVAIPLPGTGAWTGALVADVLDIRMRTALPAIAAGIVIAGCITTAVTCGVAGLM